MKTRYIMLAMAFGALTILSNCRKTSSCSESETTTEDLTALTLSKVPYSGSDTLYFLNKQGDTCIVRGDGKRYYYETEALPYSANCPGDYQKNQGYSISFLPVKGEFTFSVDLKCNNDLKVQVKKYKDYYYYDAGRIGFIGRPDDTFYIDTMTINNVLFNTIRRGYIANNYFQAYYNKEYGLLKVVNNAMKEEYSILLK